MGAIPFVGQTVRFMGEPAVVLSARPRWTRPGPHVNGGVFDHDPPRVRVEFLRRRSGRRRYLRVEELDEGGSGCTST